MKKRLPERFRFSDPFDGRSRTLLVATWALALLLQPQPSHAADPPSGTVSDGNREVTWTGPFKTPTGAATCAGPADPACDNFQLTITPPPFSFLVEIRLDPGSADWDLEVYDPSGSLFRSSGSPPGVPENVILVNPIGGTWTIAAAPFSPSPVPPSYSARAAIEPYTPPGGAAEPLVYVNYPAPGGLGAQSGEPSIGVNWKTNNAMYIAFFEQLRISFDDCSSPPVDTWQDVSFATTSVVTADPILFTDNLTGRTFASQLAGATSIMAFTDDDGVNWLPSQGGGIASGIDHQTVGGGRFHDPLTRDPQGPLYPDAVYYCSQDLADALCARSDDGGTSFGPAVPIYTALDCGGLHGSVKVAPNDGTVYVPNKGCGNQAVVVSEDNGITWDVRRVPGTSSAPFDPSAGIATDGTVYLGMGDLGHPVVSVSHDRGLTWSIPHDVGTPFGIQNIAFPVMVAGDPGRAAFGFLGTTTGGAATGSDPNWPGVWHVYVAHTYDGGATWTTINVTPNDPVQRGMICSGGIGCTGARNLLDFNDADIDKFGRVLIGYADGCVGACIDGPPNTAEDLAVVARQAGGRGLFSQFDTAGRPPAVLAKAVIFTDDLDVVHLSWTTPDDPASPMLEILEYRIYRRTAAQSNFTLIATVGAGARSYDDPIDPQESYVYRVTAVNAVGEGPFCGDIVPSLVPNPCFFAGIRSVTAPPDASCTLDLSWEAVPVGCPFASAVYNIYRDTNPAFIPGPANAIALGVGGSAYRDRNGLASGTTYYYVVRAENLSQPGGGPNGGTEDGNLVRLAGVPQGLLGPGPDFLDTLEPAAAPGYSTSSTRDAGGWSVTPDPTAHSAIQAWVVLDDQPGSPILTQKNDTLTLPPLNLRSSSVMTFWHNFDFARFPEVPNVQAAEYHSGGVLEISSDGSTWNDLGPFITTGGYNGTVQATAQSPLIQRMAWVGSSDGDNVAGRTDVMHAVRVDLGAAVQNLYGGSSLPGARVRFRLGGTFQILIGGIQGSGWGVDDILVTGLLAPGPCQTVVAAPAAEVDTLTAASAPNDEITLTWGNTCPQGGGDYEIYEGAIGSYYSHAARFCSTGGATTMTFAPAAGDSYYLVVPRNDTREGSYGQASSGAERPRGVPACFTQQITACP